MLGVAAPEAALTASSSVKAQTKAPTNTKITTSAPTRAKRSFFLFFHALSPVKKRFKSSYSNLKTNAVNERRSVHQLPSAFPCRGCRRANTTRELRTQGWWQCCAPLTESNLMPNISHAQGLITFTCRRRTGGLALSKPPAGWEAARIGPSRGPRYPCWSASCGWRPTFPRRWGWAWWRYKPRRPVNLPSC